MTEVEKPRIDDNEMRHAILSPPALFRATIVAAVVAIAVLIIIVLPAEYDIDPTGIGSAMGLTALAGANLKADDETMSKLEDFKEDSINITVPAKSGLEYKFHLLKGQSMRYDWSTNHAELYFDFHGEPAGDTTGFFESYTVSTARQMRGTFTASFEGSHGWYWENKSNSPVVVTLQTQGTYEIIGRK